MLGTTAGLGLASIAAMLALQQDLLWQSRHVSRECGCQKHRLLHDVDQCGIGMSVKLLSLPNPGWVPTLKEVPGAAACHDSSHSILSLVS
jgi:hypothetical protein